MKVPKGSAGEFARRLGDMILGDELDPDVSIVPAIDASIDANGWAQYEPTGAEAILIVRGPEAGRRKALDQLLASINSQ